MRVTLCVLSLAAFCVAQGEEKSGPGHLLATKLDQRPTDLADLARLIEGGRKEAESHPEVREALLEHLAKQKASVESLRGMGPVATAAAKSSELQALDAALEIPAPVDAAAEGDLVKLQSYVTTLLARDKTLEEEGQAAAAELAAVAKDEKEAVQRLEAARKSRDELRKSAAEASAAVRIAEAGQFGPAEWPTREAAFALVLAAREQDEKLKRTAADLSADVLAARRKVAERKVARVAEARQRLSKEVSRVNGLVRGLEAEARRARENDREELTKLLEDAPAFRKEFLRLKLETLDAEDARDEAARLSADWGDRVRSGLIRSDLQDATQLEEDLAQEDGLDQSTGELRRSIDDHQARLERLRAALKEALEVRKQGRLSRHAADKAKREARDLEARKAAAAAAAPTQEGSPEDWWIWVGDRADWDGVIKKYRTTVDEWRTAAGKLTDVANEAIGQLARAESKLARNIRELRSILLWTRQESQISGDAVKQALEDAQDLPHHAIAATRSTFDEWADVAADGDHRQEVIAMVAVALLLGGVLVFVHKKLPITYSWLERREGEEAGMFKVIAAGVRRSELVFFLALIYCGMCAVWGTWPWETGGIAVIALTPFCYRFLRVLLDVLFHPTDAHHRLIDVDNTLARILHRSGRWLLYLSAVFVTAGLLMRVGGYADLNPGFVELWWFLYQTLFSLILLVGVCRPSVIRRMVRGKGQVAASVKTLILVLYPLVVGAVLFLLVLNALRYREAVSYFRTRFLATAAVLAVAFLVFRWLQRRVLPDRDWKRTVDRDDFDDAQQYLAEGRKWFYDLLARLGLRLLVGVPALLLLMGVWRRMDWSFLGAPVFGADGNLTYSGLIWGVLAIWFTIVVLGHYRRWLKFVVLPATSLDQGLGYAVMTLSSYVVLAIGLVISLNLLKVQGDQIAVVLSALMVGIGFGLKDIVTNFISGIMLLVERPLKVGDQVVIGDDLGVVEKINLRSTTIMTFDNVGVVVPNADLVTGKLVNRSSGTPLLRTVIPVGVSYESDVRQVMELIQSCLDDHGLVLKKPGPSIYFVGFGDNSLDFSVRFWARMSDNRMQIAGDVRAAILARFREAGIEIPFPQRDLHLRGIDHDAVMKTSAVKPPSGPRKTHVDAGPVKLPEQPSDEDAQREAAEDTTSLPDPEEANPADAPASGDARKGDAS